MIKKLIITIFIILNFNYLFALTDDGSMRKDDNMIQRLNYKDDTIYNVYSSTGKWILIELEDDEEIIKKGGDNIDIDHKKNILIVRPKSMVDNTNLIVITNKRNYVFNFLKETNSNTATRKIIFNYNENSSDNKLEKKINKSLPHQKIHKDQKSFSKKNKNDGSDVPNKIVQTKTNFSYKV